jgi:hypothetical protein
MHCHSQSQRVSFDLHRIQYLLHSHEGNSAKLRLPFAAANVRLEVVMIDPFVRVAMRHCGTCFGIQQFTIALVCFCKSTNIFAQISIDCTPCLHVDLSMNPSL